MIEMKCTLRGFLWCEWTRLFSIHIWFDNTPTERSMLLPRQLGENRENFASAPCKGNAQFAVTVSLACQKRFSLNSCQFNFHEISRKENDENCSSTFIPRFLRLELNELGKTACIIINDFLSIQKSVFIVGSLEIPNQLMCERIGHGGIRINCD